MRRRLSTISSLVAVLSVAAGCGNKSRAPDGLRLVAGPGHYGFNDPRCSEEQRRAIRAATEALIGTAFPSPEQAGRLHFECDKSGPLWEVIIWNLGPGEIPAPGEFTSVELNSDFTLHQVVGGA